MFSKGFKYCFNSTSHSTVDIFYLYLQLLQSTLPHDATEMEIDETDGDKQTEKERKQALAQKRRVEMMAKMKNMQKAFLKTHKPLYEDETSQDG